MGSKKYVPVHLLLFTLFLSIVGACGERADTEDQMEENHTAHESDHPQAEGDHSHSSDQSTRIEFSSVPTAIPVGKPAVWSIKVVDAKNGGPIVEFDTAHEKLMHLIIVSADLSWFNHIHPQYQGNGLFTVEITLPTSGSYRLYADYVPKGKAQAVSQYEFGTEGTKPTPTMILPVEEPLNAEGVMIKRTGSAPEGLPDQTEGSYQVELQPMPAKLQAGQDVMLHFRASDDAGLPVAFEPYLGAMGHVVIISSDGKEFLHAHPMEEGGEKREHEPDKHEVPSSGKSGTEVIFHTNFPTPGFYKVWGQFQREGRIITAPFVLKVG